MLDLNTLGQQVKSTTSKDESSLILGDGMLGRNEDLLARALGDA